LTLSLQDPVALTQHLVRANTINPPGNEAGLAADLREMLAGMGLVTIIQPLAPERANLVAWNEGATGPRLCFTGHLDTVPLGSAPWTQDPFGAEVIDGRLYGRGSSDMKSGIAAFLSALRNFQAEFGSLPPILVVLTAGEETGCEGAKRLSETSVGALDVGALIVGEPTSGQCMVGHKGALWLKAETSGKTAHGAMPEFGDNAIYHAVDAIQKLRKFDFCIPSDPLLGDPTLNVGTIAGGHNVNSVPDSTAFDIDVRTVCGLEHDELSGRLGAYLGDKVKLRVSVDVPALSNDLNNPWIHRVAAAVESVTGESFRERTVAFFSDGPVLRQLFGEIPAVVLGPGEPSCAHQTDEWCSVERIHQCVAIYFKLLKDWKS
jgi:succinyl-diaminopimelate desuccinylase